MTENDSIEELSDFVFPDIDQNYKHMIIGVPIDCLGTSLYLV